MGIVAFAAGRGFGIFLFSERSAFDVGDVKASTRGVINERAGEPADGIEPEELGFFGTEIDDGDGVLGAVGDIEAFAAGRESQSVGRGAEEVGGARFHPDGFDDLIGFRVDDAEIIAAGVGDNEMARVGREGESGGMEMNKDFSFGCAGSEVDDGDGAFVGDVADGIDLYDGTASDRADDVAGARAPAAPIAHVRFACGEEDIVRSDADFECARHFARGQINFEKLIGEIGTDVEFGVVSRESEAGRNFLFAAEGVGVWQWNGMGRSDFAVRDGKDFDAAIDVRKIELRAVFGKDQSGEAELAFGVGLENVGGGGLGQRFVLTFVRQSDALENFAGGWIDDDEFAGFAGRHEQPAVGREGETLRTEARELKLRAERCNGLVNRQNDFALFAADRFAVWRGGMADRDQREEKQQRLHAP